MESVSLKRIRPTQRRCFGKSRLEGCSCSYFRSFFRTPSADLLQRRRFALFHVLGGRHVWRCGVAWRGVARPSHATPRRATPQPRYATRRQSTPHHGHSTPRQKQSKANADWRDVPGGTSEGSSAIFRGASDLHLSTLPGGSTCAGSLPAPQFGTPTRIT